MMSGETEVAGVWAALIALSFMIAVTITAGWWFCIYREEARQMQPYAMEPPTTVELIWEEMPVVVK
jgi:hypothetical protein